MNFLHLSTKQQSQLKKYYGLWREGYDPLAIRNELKITEKEFELLNPIFIVYARHHTKFDTKEFLKNGEVPKTVELTEDRRKQFLDLISTGLGYGKAALIMNVPLITIMDYWFNEDPLFKMQASMAAEASDAEVTVALKKKALGGKTIVETETKTEGNSEKGTFSTTTTSRTKKIVSGDFNAQKFWLINRKPDQFSPDGDVNREGNKGDILAELDKIIYKDKDLGEIYEEDDGGE